MKISDGFDARMLRPKGRSNWRTRIGKTIAFVFLVSGVALALTGGSSLIVHPQALGDLNANPAGAAVVAVAGLLVLLLGMWLWRRSGRGPRSSGGLSMSAHLMKKHD